MELIIATNNKGKLHEIQAMLPDYTLYTLRDIGYETPIPEPFFSFEENAQTKAQTIYQFSGKTVMADDSGICIEALNSAPGVISAHYAGLPADDEKNLQKVLDEMKNIEDRRAYYKAVICLIWNDATYYFEGICRGSITAEPIGNGGFGYDPIFIPDGYEETFGQLPLAIKNGLSHRGKAVRAMVDFLNGKESGL